MPVVCNRRVYAAVAARGRLALAQLRRAKNYRIKRITRVQLDV